MPHRSAKAYRSCQPVYVQQPPSLSFWRSCRHGLQSSFHRFSNHNLPQNGQEYNSPPESNIIAGIDCFFGDTKLFIDIPGLIPFWDKPQVGGKTSPVWKTTGISDYQKKWQCRDRADSFDLTEFFCNWIFLTQFCDDAIIVLDFFTNMEQLRQKSIQGVPQFHRKKTFALSLHRFSGVSSEINDSILKKSIFSEVKFANSCWMIRKAEVTNNYQDRSE